VSGKTKPEKVYDENAFGTGRLSVTKVLDLCLPSGYF